MLTLEDKIEIPKNQCKKHNITAYEIGKNTSISKSSAHIILTGINENPNNKTLNIILDYIQNKIVGTHIKEPINIVAEDPVEYNKLSK